MHCKHILFYQSNDQNRQETQPKQSEVKEIRNEELYGLCCAFSSHRNESTETEAEKKIKNAVGYQKNQEQLLQTS